MARLERSPDARRLGVARESRHLRLLALRRAGRTTGRRSAGLHRAFAVAAAAAAPTHCKVHGAAGGEAVV